ncbi:MAG: amidohydrolase [Firmicutes bacterium]|nr:amidohydrolase [Bacillota bacterium]
MFDAKEQCLSLQPYMVSVRRRLHEHPELAGREFETVRFIRDELERMGIEYINIPDGGVLGIINDGAEGKTVLLRADVDALPMKENEVNGGGQPKVCVSSVDGIAHMCGHDSHVAMLLGAASVLNERRSELPGRVFLLFERGEEGGKNIYYVLKYFEDHDIHPDAAFSIHCRSSVPTGKIEISGGPHSAGNVAFEIELTGKGGHGSRPDLSNNPIDCFVAIANALKDIRMKEVAPTDLLTYNIGVVDGGTKRNIIPEKLFFTGTVRFYNAQVGLHFKKRIKEIVTAMAELYRCKAEFKTLFGPSLPLVNNDEVGSIAADCVRALYGEEAWGPTKAGMGGESFSLMSVVCPSAQADVGCGNVARGMISDHHHPGFEVDEDCLPYGAALFCEVAHEYLERLPEIAFEPFPGNADDIMKFIDRPAPPRYDK